MGLKGELIYEGCIYYIGAGAPSNPLSNAHRRRLHVCIVPTITMSGAVLLLPNTPSWCLERQLFVVCIIYIHSHVCCLLQWKSLYIMCRGKLINIPVIFVFVTTEQVDPSSCTVLWPVLERSPVNTRISDTAKSVRGHSIIIPTTAYI